MSSSTVPAAGAAAAMLLVGTSTAVSATIADYPVLSGQALRYALAAAILLAVVRHRRLPRAGLTPVTSCSCWHWPPPAWRASTSSWSKPPGTRAPP